MADASVPDDSPSIDASASDWVVLADVEAPFTPAVLAALGDHDIAAQSAPSVNGQSILGSGQHIGPTETISVPRSQRTQAREVLAGVLAELREALEAERNARESQAFESIAANLQEEGVGSGALTADEDFVEPRRWNPQSSDEHEWSEFARPEVSEEFTDFSDGEHFIPPEPPPLPAVSNQTRWAWAALAFGPAYLLVSLFLGWTANGVLGFLAVASSIGGGAFLIARMPDRPALEDRGDDGAVL